LPLRGANRPGKTILDYNFESYSSLLATKIREKVYFLAVVFGNDLAALGFRAVA